MEREKRFPAELIRAVEKLSDNIQQKREEPSKIQLDSSQSGTRGELATTFEPLYYRFAENQ